MSNDKTFAKALKKEILKYTQKVYCFTGDAPDTEKRLICMNLNENATQYDAFITTSVLLAGNSIDKKHFDKCYVFIGDRSDNPRDVHQMIKRVRNLNDNEITCHITYSQYLEQKYDMTDIIQWMKSTDKYMNEPHNWFNCFDYNEHGILEHKKNFNFDLFCRYKQQEMNKHCYLSWYIGLCYENKYNTETINEIPAIKTNVDIKETKREVKEEHYDKLSCVEFPTEEEYEKLKQFSYNEEDELKKEKFILAGNYHLIDKPETHEETINNVEFIKTYYHPKKRKQFKFLLNIAYNTDTYDIFIEFINKKTQLEYQIEGAKKYYQDIELYQIVINALNDIMKSLGYVNFGDVERVVDGTTLKNCFEENKIDILKKLSILCYQLKLYKIDMSNYNFKTFMETFNAILESLTSGKIINVSKSKSHDIRYKKYQFVHEFITHGDKIVPDAITIKFRNFEQNNFNTCCLLNDDADVNATDT